jgi:hypothetical protein
MERMFVAWMSPDPETGNLYCIARDTFERSQHEIIVQTSNELKLYLTRLNFQ